MTLFVVLALALAGLWSVEIVALVAAAIHRAPLPARNAKKASQLTANA